MCNIISPHTGTEKLSPEFYVSYKIRSKMFTLTILYQSPNQKQCTVWKRKDRPFQIYTYFFCAILGGLNVHLKILIQNYPQYSKYPQYNFTLWLFFKKIFLCHNQMRLRGITICCRGMIRRLLCTWLIEISSKDTHTQALINSTLARYKDYKMVQHLGFIVR